MAKIAVFGFTLEKKNNSFLKVSKDLCCIKGHLSESIFQFVGGLCTGRGHIGSATIEESRTEARFVKIAVAGLMESNAYNIFLPKKLRIIQ